MTLLAGFARAEITPPLGLPMGGYAARSGVAEATLDPLSCRLAVLRGAGAPVVLAAVDLVYVAGPWAAAARRRIAAALDTTPERVLLAATHTHSGPAVFGSSPAGEGRLADYEAALPARIVAAARAASADAVPVTLHAGDDLVTGVGGSRRRAGEELEQHVRLIAARRAGGSLAGVVAAFGCHPTVLPPSSLRWSADLFGAAVSAAEADLGAPVVLFNGAAADISTRFTRRAASAEEMRRLGALLGAAIARAARGSREMPAAEPGGQSRTLPLRLRALPAEGDAAAQAAGAAAMIDSARERGAGEAELRLAASRLEGALAQLWIARHGGWRALLGRLPETAEVQRIALGGGAILAAPGEVFAESGRALGRRGVLVAGYANDYLGYLVPPARAAETEYESLLAAVAPESVAAILGALAELDGDV